MLEFVHMFIPTCSVAELIRKRVEWIVMRHALISRCPLFLNCRKTKTPIGGPSSINTCTSTILKVDLSSLQPTNFNKYPIFQVSGITINQAHYIFHIVQQLGKYVYPSLYSQLFYLDIFGKSDLGGGVLWAYEHNEAFTPNPKMV